MRKIITLILAFISITGYGNDLDLPIPPILKGSEIKIEHGELKLPTGIAKTMGYNGNYLGPTIVLSKGDFINFKIINKLKEDTTFHWHGLHVPAEFDGGPLQIIKKGKAWEPKFKISQPAATLWYHPHLLGKTAKHVYNGLAGMLYIKDSYSESLNIPKEYGVNDFPIIIQDRQVKRDGSFYYRPDMHEEIFGYTGNTILTNGAVEPTLTIPAGTYRFRLLNGSNSSIFRIRFSDNTPFTVIASDGGFLPETVSVSEVVLSPGERFEILKDFGKDKQVFLVTDIYNGDSYNSLKIVTSSNEGKNYSHPKSFTYTPVKYDRSSNSRRTFVMETRMMGRFTINGRRMSMKRVEFKLPKNSTEIWTIRNVGFGMMQVPHSFHVHDVQFSIISINGRKPGPLYSGPKDTILVMPGESYEIALRFQEYTGIYMYHCHFLEHEDDGMMGQFLIE